ncbi:MAG TPA: pyridoxal kinase PdxY [Rectinemataceae bacterium]|nr:pyridoxal kinase PdxY [Rectinemataceae bacterium]
MRRVLSIQSHVVYGHVGNRASVFPLERMGVEVWPLNTVQFSNHTGYGHWKGQVFSGSHVAELWEGLDAMDCAPICDALLSGYMGTLDIGYAILDIVASIRKRNPLTLYCCDPVMGDYERGLYVQPGIPEFFRERALPEASIIKPNQFEAEILSGVAIRGMEDARRACDILHAKGPDIVLITSLEAIRGQDAAFGAAARDSETPETPGDHIRTLLSFGGGAYVIGTPRFSFPVPPHGAGDMASALFLGNYLETGDALLSFERMASAVHRIFEATSVDGSAELAIIRAQDAFAERQRLFPAEKVW